MTKTPKKKWHTLDEVEKSLGIRRVKGYAVVCNHREHEPVFIGAFPNRYSAVDDMKQGGDSSEKIVKCEITYSVKKK